tara:strand:- start:12 stop:398 length:387 start_codon:yes stop_codon:yes gene_type:complete
MASISPADFLSKFQEQVKPQMDNFGSSPLIAHVNAEGTAHDWQAPGHGAHRVPGGRMNPHGVRGGITWGDGRAKYSQEDQLRKMKAGQIDAGHLKHDDRFWPQNTKPGDGSYMTPEAQELIRRIENES